MLPSPPEAPRYAILEHDHPILHWDLMLQAGEILRTWRLAAPPADGVVLAAEAVFDHRLLYLEYEGPISGGRGCVTRWDGGTLVWLCDQDGRVEVELHGRRLSGRLELRRLAGDGPQGWEAVFRGTILPA